MIESKTFLFSELPLAQPTWTGTFFNLAITGTDNNKKSLAQSNWMPTVAITIHLVTKSHVLALIGIQRQSNGGFRRLTIIKTRMRHRERTTLSGSKKKMEVTFAERCSRTIRNVTVRHLFCVRELVQTHLVPISCQLIGPQVMSLRCSADYLCTGFLVRQIIGNQLANAQ